MYHRLASVSLFLDRICVFLLCLSSFLPYRPLSSFHPNPSNGLDRSTRNSDSPLASASFDFRYIACVMRGRIEIFSSTYHLLCFSLLLSLKLRIPHPLPLPFCWSFFLFLSCSFLHGAGRDGTQNPTHYHKTDPRTKTSLAKPTPTYKIVRWPTPLLQLSSSTRNLQLQRQGVDFKGWPAVRDTGAQEEAGEHRHGPGRAEVAQHQRNRTGAAAARRFRRQD